MNAGNKIIYGLYRPKLVITVNKSQYLKLLQPKKVKSKYT